MMVFNGCVTLNPTITLSTFIMYSSGILLSIIVMIYLLTNHYDRWIKQGKLHVGMQVTWVIIVTLIIYFFVFNYPLLLFFVFGMFLIAITFT